MSALIASGFNLPWWVEWLLLAIVYAPYWVPALIGGLALWAYLRRRK